MKNNPAEGGALAKPHTPPWPFCRKGVELAVGWYHAWLEVNGQIFGLVRWELKGIGLAEDFHQVMVRDGDVSRLTLRARLSQTVKTKFLAGQIPLKDFLLRPGDKRIIANKPGVAKDYGQSAWNSKTRDRLARKTLNFLSVPFHFSGRRFWVELWEMKTVGLPPGRMMVSRQPDWDMPLTPGFPPGIHILTRIQKLMVTWNLEVVDLHRGTQWLSKKAYQLSVYIAATERLPVSRVRHFRLSDCITSGFTNAHQSWCV